MVHRKIVYSPNTREMPIKILRCYLSPGKRGIVKKKTKTSHSKNVNIGTDN